MSDKKNESSFIASTKSFLSGGFGGICLVLVGHPLDTIKVRLQTSNIATSTLECARQIVAKEGFLGLYRGLISPLIMVTPIFSLCFLSYDFGKKIAQSFSQDKNAPLSLAGICFAGGFSAVPTTLLMTPSERIKVILQTDGIRVSNGEKPRYNGVISALAGVLKEGGIRSLFRGTMATLLRDVPGSVGYFAAYELTKQALTPKGAKSTDLNTGAVLFAGGMAGIANWVVAIPPDVLKSRLQSAAPGEYKGVGDVLVKLLKNEGPKALFKGLGPAIIRAFPANAACFFGVEFSLKIMNQLF